MKFDGSHCVIVKGRRAITVRAVVTLVTKRVTIGVDCVGVRRTAVRTREVPYKLVLYMSHATGMFVKEHHKMPIRSQYWAYVVLDFLDIVL